VKDYGWQGDEPSRNCAGCGERIILKAEPVWFERFPVVRTWHARCHRSTEPNADNGAEP
jgi:hypothetical protein